MGKEKGFKLLLFVILETNFIYCQKWDNKMDETQLLIIIIISSKGANNHSKTTLLACNHRKKTLSFKFKPRSNKSHQQQIHIFIFKTKFNSTTSNNAQQTL